MRRRLDAEMVRRGLADGRDEAGALVAGGRVLVGGAPADNPTRLVDASEPVSVVSLGGRFVSRGGDKLDAAMVAFELDAGGVHALDAGASTGGFTDCLLQRGAQRVVALDVGYNQLHERLRRDERVTVMERTNLRHVDPGVLGTFDAVVADLSFISLRAVAGALVTASAPSGWMVWLAKPQFEVDRAAADRGRGVITDPELWSSALAGVAEAAATAGASVVDAIPSPLRGASGNTEFLLHVRHAAGATNTPATNPATNTAAVLARAVATASDPEAFGASG